MLGHGDIAHCSISIEKRTSQTGFVVFLRYAAQYLPPESEFENAVDWMERQFPHGNPGSAALDILLRETKRAFAKAFGLSETVMEYADADAIHQYDDAQRTSENE